MAAATDDNGEEAPKGVPGGKFLRGALNVLGGAVPLVGGFLSAGAGVWSENEQEQFNNFLKHWLKMLREEMEEKGRTIVEIMQRLDMHDEAIKDRVSSREYQSLLRKAFRDWSGTESETKREYIRNILTNAANPGITSDDVIRMFIQWIGLYTELHFSVIASIYNDPGVTRARIWEKVGKDEVREDSAEADLFKLLIRDLSTGSIVRQHREKDYSGNFLRKPAQRRRKGILASSTTESAFEDTKGYELTALGDQFVHYAMTDLPVRVAYDPKSSETADKHDEEAEAFSG